MSNTNTGSISSSEIDRDLSGRFGVFVELLGVEFGVLVELLGLEFGVLVELLGVEFGVLVKLLGVESGVLVGVVELGVLFAEVKCGSMEFL